MSISRLNYKSAGATRQNKPSRSSRPIRIRIEADYGSDDWVVTEFSEEGGAQLFRGSHADACAFAKGRMLDTCGND